MNWVQIEDMSPVDRIDRVDKLIHQITELLPCINDSELVREEYFFTTPDGCQILSTEEVEIETLSNFFNQLYGEGTCIVGKYYNSPEREKSYAGMYYMSIA